MTSTLSYGTKQLESEGVMKDSITLDPSEIRSDDTTFWEVMKYPLIGLLCAVFTFIIAVPERIPSWTDDAILVFAVLVNVWNVGQYVIVRYGG